MGYLKLFLCFFYGDIQVVKFCIGNLCLVKDGKDTSNSDTYQDWFDDHVFHQGTQAYRPEREKNLGKYSKVNSKHIVF